MDQIIKVLIKTIAKCFLSLSLDKGMYKDPEKSYDGMIVLRINKIYAVYGVLSWIPAVIIGFLTIKDFDYYKSDFSLPLGLIAFFFICGVFLIMYTKSKRIEADSQKIVYIDLFGRRKEMRWFLINSVSFSNLFQEITLKSDDIKFKVDIKLTGSSSLMKMIEQNVSESIRGDVLEQYGLV